MRQDKRALPKPPINENITAREVRLIGADGQQIGVVSLDEALRQADEAKLDLLPMAFTKQGSMWIWIDTASRLLVLDTSSQGRADEVVTLLVESLPGLSVSLLDTQTSPQAAMAHWLKEQEPPVGFTVDRECELKSANEEKAVVRYARHPLDIEEVQAHIDAGKLPTKLALTWDDRVSFMLTEGLQIKKVSFLDTVFEGTKADDGGFDTDVAIATGELVKLIPDLIEALGCGVPVLISDKVNIWREIEADEAGLVAPDTVRGTVDLLQRWQGLAPPQRATMASNALRCFTSRFRVEAMASSILSTVMQRGGIAA